MTGAQFLSVYHRYRDQQARAGKGIVLLEDFAAEISTRQEMVLRELRTMFAGIAMMDQGTQHVIH
jgi:hypothetical protein